MEHGTNALNHKEEKNGRPEHPDKHCHGQVGSPLKVTIDGKAHTIPAGTYSVADLKALGGVTQCYDLDQLVDGKLKELPDGGHVTIRCDETFISRPKSGASS